jgi:hypothetical protein
MTDVKAQVVAEFFCCLKMYRVNFWREAQSLRDLAPSSAAPRPANLSPALTTDRVKIDMRSTAYRNRPRGSLAARCRLESGRGHGYPLVSSHRQAAHRDARHDSSVGRARTS